MRTLTANEAKTQFGQFIDMAQREPVRVMRRDRVVGVLVSAEDYEDFIKWAEKRNPDTAERAKRVREMYRNTARTIDLINFR